MVHRIGWAGLLAFFLAGCSLNPRGDYSRLQIQVNEPAHPLPELLQSPGGESASDFHPNFMSFPFDCWAINVMAPDIGPTGNGGNNNPAAVLPGLYAGTSYCSYPGITSSPFTGTATVNLLVPSGPQRIVQAVGIQANGDTVCTQSGPVASVQNSGQNANYFEVGRAVLDIFSNQQVAITDVYTTLGAADQAARKLNCGTHGLPLTASFQNNSGNNCQFNTSSTFPSYPAFTTGTQSLVGSNMTAECTPGTFPDAWAFFAFAAGPNIGSFNSLMVNWSGQAGYTSVSCNFASPLAPNNGTGSLYIYNTGGSWEHLGTSSFSTMGGSTANPITDYVNAAGLVYVGVVGASSGSCSIAQTNSITVTPQ